MARKRKRGPLQAIFKPKHAYLPGTDILRQMDIDVLADELQVDEQGKQDGADTLPPPDGKTVALKEREILGRLRDEWDETVKGAKRAYDSYVARLGSLTAEGELDALIAAPRQIEVLLRETAREDRDRLIADFAEVRAAKRQLQGFKEAERITRLPQDRKSALHRWFVLLTAALVEFVVNTSIFAQGDEFGFAGATTKVLVVPVMNIGGCWLWTHWLARHVQRPSLGHKIIGVFGCVLAGVWLLGINLAVAHWREAADAVLSVDAARASFESAIRNPFELHSYQSWALFLIGCFAGAAAIYEGWNWDDPHPGYGRIARKARDLEAKWRAEREAVVSRLQAISSSGVQSLTDAQRKAELAQADRPTIVSNVEALREDLQLYRDHLQAVADELIARYREANRRARTGDAPPQFSEPLSLELTVPKLPPLSSGVRRRQVEGRLAAAMNQVTEALADVCGSIPAASELEKAEVPA